MNSAVDIKNAISALSKYEIKELEGKYKNVEYLSSLNHGQRIAATREEGNYLVIAGPGTGKTHTLVYRVVHLVKIGVDPKSIVVITFTRKAGNVLKERLNRLIPNTSLGFVGTFHAFSNHISMSFGSVSPFSGFRLLDQEDDVSVHKLVMADFREFNTKIRARKLQKIISYCCNTQIEIEDYIKMFDARELIVDAQNLIDYRKAYESYKVDHMLANYDDMIQVITKFLKKEGGNKITAPFEYLMVDEYQDTNQMQLDFIKTLDIPNMMAIGDDFQGIYSFRGADHRIILNFYNDFDKAKMVKLIENYRSDNRIITYVNKTVESSKLGFHKELNAVSKYNGTAEVISASSIDGHKDFILKNIKDKPNETHALIYRYNKNRTIYEKMLIENNLEYAVYGGIRLLERKHIKDILAFLMVYLNRRDIVSFSRVLTLLPGIGPKSAKILIDSNFDGKIRVGEKTRELVNQVKEIMNSEEIKEKLYSKICDFYFSIYEYVESENYSKDEIEDDFKMVAELLKSYDSLQNFITNLILDPVMDFKKGERPNNILTTIHSAKGLEFDNVYYFHTHDWYKNYDLEALEEDRRLFYVGISRAKHNLYIFDHVSTERNFGSIISDFESGYESDYGSSIGLDIYKEGNVQTELVDEINNTTSKSLIRFLIIVFFGPFGVHRFMKGDILKGVLYLLTFGGFGILWIRDIIIEFYNLIRD